MYVIREYEPYSKYAPLSCTKVHGITMGVYLENEQPYSIEDSDYVLSIIKKWDTLEEAQQFLRTVQRINGVE